MKITTESKINKDINEAVLKNNKNMRKPEDRVAVVPATYENAVEEDEKMQENAEKVDAEIKKNADGITPENPGTGKAIKRTAYTEKFELDESLFEDTPIDEGKSGLNPNGMISIGKRLDAMKKKSNVKEECEGDECATEETNEDLGGKHYEFFVDPDGMACVKGTTHSFQSVADFIDWAEEQGATYEEIDAPETIDYNSLVW